MHTNIYACDQCGAVELVDANADPTEQASPEAKLRDLRRDCVRCIVLPQPGAEPAAGVGAMRCYGQEEVLLA